jgi:hypothetical protein
MPVLSTGNPFTATEQITSTKLNNIANGADFTDTNGTAIDSSGSTGTCVNGGGLEVTASGQLQLKDDDLDFAKLSDDASLTSGRFGIMNIVYPIGSIFIGVVSTNPDTLLFGGTGLTSWSAFGAGRVLVGQDSSDSDFNVAEDTDGVKTVTLTAAQSGLPSHSHTQLGGGFNGNIGIEAGNQRTENLGQTGTTGGTNAQQPHTNLQPYIVVYMWKRVSL